MNTDVELQKQFLKVSVNKPIVIVGLMGAGKTSISKKLAEELDYNFVDSDHVIVKHEGMEIKDIFAEKGEPYFREVEREVIRQLLEDSTPHVLGIGGGAFMNDQTRHLIKGSATSIYLRATLGVLMERIPDASSRPMLQTKVTPQESMAALMEIRAPYYEQADITVDTLSEPEQETLNRVINALYTHLKP